MYLLLRPVSQILKFTSIFSEFIFSDNDDKGYTHDRSISQHNFEFGVMVLIELCFDMSSPENISDFKFLLDELGCSPDGSNEDIDVGRLECGLLCVDVGFDECKKPLDADADADAGRDFVGVLEHGNEVVVASPCGDAADLGLGLEADGFVDDAGVVVESAGEAEVEGDVL